VYLFAAANLDIGSSANVHSCVCVHVLICGVYMREPYYNSILGLDYLQMYIALCARTCVWMYHNVVYMFVHAHKYECACV
jgi:hypothetical protein